MIIVLLLNLSHLVLFLLEVLDSQLQLFIMPVLFDVHRPEFFPRPRHLRICRYQHLQNNFVQDQLVVADTEHFPLSGVNRLFVMDDDSIDGHYRIFLSDCLDVSSVQGKVGGIILDEFI